MDQSALESREDKIVGAELVKNKTNQAFEPRIPKYHKIQKIIYLAPPM
jgi:hypothetical protein